MPISGPLDPDVEARLKQLAEVSRKEQTYTLISVIAELGLDASDL